MPTFPTPAAITLEIRNAHGEIAVELADVDTTTVSVVATDNHPLGFLDDLFRSLPARLRGESVDEAAPADAPPRGELARIELDEEDAVLVVDTEPVAAGWRSAVCSVRITAPSGSGVRVHSQSADVVVTGLTGAVDIRSASGDLTLDQVGGAALLGSASGDIRVRRAGDLEARTASGTISVGAVSGRAVLHSTSGDIEVHSAATDIEARSVSGNVKVADAHAGSARLAAVSGDVQVGVHAGTAASLDLHTVSGKARSEIEIVPELPSGAQAELGIVVKTTSGDIRVHRAA